MDDVWSSAAPEVEFLILAERVEINDAPQARVSFRAVPTHLHG